MIETILRERASLIHDNTIRADMAKGLKQRFQSTRNIIKAISFGKGLLSLWQFTKNNLIFQKVEKTKDDILEIVHN